MGNTFGLILAVAAGILAPGNPFSMSYAMAGWMVGSMVDAKMAGNGNRSKTADTKITSSTYGSTIAKIWGTQRVGGTIIWGTNLSTYATDKYQVSMAVLVCAGPIKGINKIVCGGKVVYQNGSTDFDITIYNGDETQTSDPTMSAALGASKTPAYRGYAYVVFKNFALDDYGNQLPRDLTFEVRA